jgi:excisionase family DNA binding protein
VSPNQPLESIKFYNVKEVAEIMSTSKMTIYRLINEGELPAVRVGRSIRVSEQAVREYLQDAAVVPNS